MLNLKRILPLAAVAAMACSGAAHADPILDASNYGAIVGNASATVNGTTFSAAGGQGYFVEKSTGGVSGLGIAGGTVSDEIDIGEMATVSFAATRITDFSISLLFNGPEFGDVHEVAQVSAFKNNALVGTYFLTVGDDGTTPGATWTGAGTVINLSPPDGDHGGAWLVSGNPFGSMAIDTLQFTAVSGICSAGATCTSQSDYVISTINAVPEPGTYALMAAGLGMMGFMARRRRHRA